MMVNTTDTNADFKLVVQESLSCTGIVYKTAGNARPTFAPYTISPCLMLIILTLDLYLRLYQLKGNMYYNLFCDSMIF